MLLKALFPALGILATATRDRRRQETGRTTPALQRVTMANLFLFIHIIRKKGNLIRHDYI